MTPLSRPVRRSVPSPRRPLVVSLTLESGEAVLSVREKGRRQGYAITVAGLFLVLAKRAADLAVAQRKAKRRGKA